MDGETFPTLEKLEREITCLALSVRGGLPLEDFPRDFRDEMHYDLDSVIDFYGCSSPAQFLDCFSDSVVLLPAKDAAEYLGTGWPPKVPRERDRDRPQSPPPPLDPKAVVIVAKTNPKTEHLRKMIAGQHASRPTRVGGIVPMLGGASSSGAPTSSGPQTTEEVIQRLQPAMIINVDDDDTSDEDENNLPDNQGDGGEGIGGASGRSGDPRVTAERCPTTPEDPVPPLRPRWSLYTPSTSRGEEKAEEEETAANHKPSVHGRNKMKSGFPSRRPEGFPSASSPGSWPQTRSQASSCGSRSRVSAFRTDEEKEVFLREVEMIFASLQDHTFTPVSLNVKQLKEMYAEFFDKECPDGIGSRLRRMDDPFEVTTGVGGEFLFSLKGTIPPFPIPSSSHNQSPGPGTSGAPQPSSKGCAVGESPWKSESARAPSTSQWSPPAPKEPFTHSAIELPSLHRDRDEETPTTTRHHSEVMEGEDEENLLMNFSSSSEDQGVQTVAEMDEFPSRALKGGAGIQMGKPLATVHPFGVDLMDCPPDELHSRLEEVTRAQSVEEDPLPLTGDGGRVETPVGGGVPRRDSFFGISPASSYHSAPDDIPVESSNDASVSVYFSPVQERVRDTEDKREEEGDDDWMGGEEMSEPRWKEDEWEMSEGETLAKCEIGTWKVMIAPDAHKQSQGSWNSALPSGAAAKNVSGTSSSLLPKSAERQRATARVAGCGEESARQMLDHDNLEKAEEERGIRANVGGGEEGAGGMNAVIDEVLEWIDHQAGLPEGFLIEDFPIQFAREMSERKGDVPENHLLESPVIEIVKGIIFARASQTPARYFITFEDDDFRVRSQRQDGEPE